VGGVSPLEQKVSDYFTGGRFFSAIEMAEGEDMIQMVNTFMGPDVLMYASDYPHLESRFPNSVHYFLGFETISDEMRKRLFWENPVRLLGEP
jgi:predicted TIM-barrel fold metal-dependent hydrolase